MTPLLIGLSFVALILFLSGVALIAWALFFYEPTGQKQRKPRS